MKIKLGDPILQPLSDEQIESLSRPELIAVLKGDQQIRRVYEEYINELHEAVSYAESLKEALKDRLLVMAGILCRIRSKLFSPSSERSKYAGRRGSSRPKKSGPKARAKRLPSERYPDADIIERDITFEHPPLCKCCGEQLEDSGMVETSEQLTVIPKKILITRENRHKYRCKKCHADIATAPTEPRVVPGGVYSDEMIVDATLSKYCDLIPMERYSQMAKRQGFGGLPPQSLIAVSFKLAEFLYVVYSLIRHETLNTKVLLADETPHRMLEGDEKRNWSLWGFQGVLSCFFECHDTRSGDVATVVLKDSNCEVLLSDVYSGYRKAVRETNEWRALEGTLAPIKPAYCNAHARREFVSDDPSPEAQYMIDQYKELYKLEASAQAKPADEVLAIRGKMIPIYEAMRNHSHNVVESFSSKSVLGRAFGYFLKNYEGLILFLTNALVPIDNNASERQLRNPVVGRKTWYGTHSRDGARAAAIHFTLVESCKLNNLNPRKYYAEMIRRLHSQEDILTPRELARAWASAPPIESS